MSLKSRHRKRWWRRALKLNKTIQHVPTAVHYAIYSLAIGLPHKIATPYSYWRLGDNYMQSIIDRYGEPDQNR